jgi:hypothetical protein
MEMSELLPVILSVVSLSTIVMAVALVYNNKRRSSREEEKNTRAELSYMRERIERQIYEMTEKLHSDSNRWKDTNHLIINSLEDDKLKASEQAFNSSFFDNLGVNPNEVKIEKDLVFFLTPFHNDFDKVYSQVKDICSELDLRCTRGDEDFVKGNILQYIIKRIMSSSVVIANLNGRNPNVYYELGIAHAIGKPVILITNQANFKEIPFDLRSNKLILYDGLNNLKPKLTNSLAKTLIESNRK